MKLAQLSEATHTPSRVPQTCSSCGVVEVKGGALMVVMAPATKWFSFLGTPSVEAGTRSKPY